jgi:hypothetical protein
MRVINNVDTPDPFSLGAENQGKVTITLDAQPIGDGGLYSGEGIFIQTQGYVAHFERDPKVLAAAGFSDAEDVSADPAVTSRLLFTVTQRFSRSDPRVRQELSLEVKGGPSSPIASQVMSLCGLAGQPWSELYTGADVTRLRGHGVVHPACSAPPEIAADAILPLDVGVIANRGLDYVESSAQGAPGSAWFITAQSTIGGRTLRLGLPAGFATPDAVQALLNGYSSPGTGGICLDVQYTDLNQCGAGASWPVGYVHASAVDYAASTK